MGGHHHHALWRQVEGLGRRQVDHRLGLVVARDFGAEDRVPDEAVAARQVDHQRDVAVRARRQPERRLQPCQSRCRIRPGIEPVPGEVEIGAGRLLDVVEPEVMQHDIQVAPMQAVELAERQLATAHLGHGRLVLGTPGVGEGEPVHVGIPRRQRGTHLACDRRAPVDQGAEDIEDQCIDGRLHRVGRLSGESTLARRRAGENRDET